MYLVCLDKFAQHVNKCTVQYSYKFNGILDLHECFIGSIEGTSHSGRATLSGDSQENGCKSRLKVCTTAQYSE